MDKPAERSLRRHFRGGKLTLGLLPELVGYSLRKAQIAVFQAFQGAVAPHEITPGQFGVLILIHENAGLSQSELGLAVGIDRSTMVAVIDRLEGRGLVVRAPSPKDRRSYALRLSPEGERLLDELVPRIRAHESDIARDMTKQEQALLITLLNKIARAGANPTPATATPVTAAAAVPADAEGVAENAVANAAENQEAPLT